MESNIQFKEQGALSLGHLLGNRVSVKLWKWFPIWNDQGAWVEGTWNPSFAEVEVTGHGGREVAILVRGRTMGLRIPSPISAPTAVDFRGFQSNERQQLQIGLGLQHCWAAAQLCDNYELKKRLLEQWVPTSWGATLKAHIFEYP